MYACKRKNWRAENGRLAKRKKIQVDLPPFSNVGVDYFGPFKTIRGRSQVKSRSVHLDMHHSLTTDSCIDALRRFIVRRGQVLHIQSDNGTNLVAEVGRVPKNCSQVKVLLEIFTQVKVIV